MAYPYDNPTEGKPNRKEGFQYYSNGTIVSVFTKPKVFRFQKFATSLTIFANGLHLNSEAKLIAASYYDSTERRKGTLLEVHGTNLDLRFSGSLKDQLLQTYAGLSRDGHVSIVSSPGEVTGKFLSFDNQVLTAKTVIGQTEIGQTEFSFKPGTHLARSGNFEGTLLFPVEGRKIQIEHRYSFGADGIYSSAYLAEKIELKDTEGKWVTVPAHSHVTFRHGLLHYFYPGQDITP